MTLRYLFLVWGGGPGPARNVGPWGLWTAAPRCCRRPPVCPSLQGSCDKPPERQTQHRGFRWCTSCCACARAMLARPRFWRGRDTPSRLKIKVSI